MLVHTQRELASGAGAPQKPEDFERLLLAAPNSSLLWVQFLAYYVNAADIEAARLIAQRALKTMHFREVQEKFNVYMAWLNLEYKYGNQQSLDNALQQGVSENKGKQLVLALAQVFEDNNDVQKAITLINKYLKRPQFKKSKKVWMALQRLQLRAKDFKLADETLTRSLQSLSKHKLIETISKYALAHFDFGSHDKARSLFEDLIQHYPKRTDLWHLYVDREVKLGHVQQARQLYERMLAGKATARNMKTVFKKYLALEMRYGDEHTQEIVRQKAAEYISQMTQEK
ncbi:hypothetical protein EON65_51730 [archaeon]|nr:MAG: hypothetical protein EON65_51730 [archaeon]